MAGVVSESKCWPHGSIVILSSSPICATTAFSDKAWWRYPVSLCVWSDQIQTTSTAAVLIVVKQFPACPGLRLAWTYLVYSWATIYIMIISYDSGDHFHQDCLYRAAGQLNTKILQTCFRDLFVRNCLSYNPKWTLPDEKIIYSKSIIPMLQNYTIVNNFWRELAKISTEPENNSITEDRLYWCAGNISK
jgi:hypothetical protein